MISTQVTSQSVKHIIIGDKTYLKESGSLSIQNCLQLEDIRIGDGCYCAKQKVRISDCPTLHIIIIGSNCFQSQENNTSLIIDKNRKLCDIHFGSHTFEFFNSITINGLVHCKWLCVDCDMLQCINVGLNCFNGCTDFTLQSSNELKYIKKMFLSWQIVILFFNSYIVMLCYG